LFGEFVFKESIGGELSSVIGPDTAVSLNASRISKAAATASSPAQSTTKLRSSGSGKAERVANTNSGDRATPTTRKAWRRPLSMTSVASPGRTARACA